MKDYYIQNSYGLVYLLTCTVNSKRYVGQTTSFLHRMQGYNNNSYKGNEYLNNALKKHNRNSFNVKILQYCFNKEELDNAEIYWINFYNTRNNKLGYNLKGGGSHGKHHDATKENMSGDNCKFYKKISTDEILELYNNRISMSKIAKEFNVSTGVIFKRLKKLGVDTAFKKSDCSYGKYDSIIIEKINNKVLVKDIAIELNISTWSIRKRIKYLNLENQVQATALEYRNKKHKGRTWKLSYDTKQKMKHPMKEEVKQKLRKPKLNKGERCIKLKIFHLIWDYEHGEIDIKKLEIKYGYGYFAIRYYLKLFCNDLYEKNKLKIIDRKMKKRCPEYYESVEKIEKYIKLLSNFIIKDITTNIGISYDRSRRCIKKLLLSNKVEIVGGFGGKRKIDIYKYII